MPEAITGPQPKVPDFPFLAVSETSTSPQRPGILWKWAARDLSGMLCVVNMASTPSRAHSPHSRDWNKIFLHHFWILEQIQNKHMVSPNLRQFTLATNTPTEGVLRFIYLSFPYLVLILNKEETMLDGKPMSKDIWIKEFVLSTHFPFTAAKEKVFFFVVKVMVFCILSLRYRLSRSFFFRYWVLKTY